MALIYCDFCRKQYDHSEISCPECEYPTKFQNTLYKVIWGRYWRTENRLIFEKPISESSHPDKCLGKKILVIEDDRDMRDLVARHLEFSGFDVLQAEDGIKGQAFALHYSPHLIVLDLMLAKVDGITLCQRLRRDERTSNIPILMITALEGLKDKLTGFYSRPDDFITKPFALHELNVRIKELLRTYRPKFNSTIQQEILNYGPLTLVPERFEAIWFESPVRLTHLEFEILHCLLQRHGQTVSPGLILKEVWGYEPDDDIEMIRVHVRHLRKKLESDPHKPTFLKTIYGMGYCLDLPPMS